MLDLTQGQEKEGDMTRKDYQKVAAAVYWATLDNGENDTVSKASLIALLGLVFTVDNEGLDLSKFTDACNGRPFPKSLAPLAKL